MFLAGYSNKKLKSSNMDPQKMHFKLYITYTEKVYGSKLGHLNHVLIPLCVMELICSLAPDKSGRYTGFWYANSKMINQLDACQLEHDKVFHIHMELLDENIIIFIKHSPNPSAWKISKSGKWSTLRQLDICLTMLIHSSWLCDIPMITWKIYIGSIQAKLNLRNPITCYQG